MRTIAAVLVLLASAQDKVKVACVGDSITFGSRVEEREKNAYPAVLGRLLGDGHDVRNFGVSGATLLKKGDKPWWKEKAFAAATEFQPQIVVIKLGTNDTKPQNWKSKADFEADLKALAEHFRGLPSKPKVYVCLPAAVLKDNFGISAASMAEELPMIRKVAEAEKLPLIDVQAGIASAELFDKDGIHPNAAGAKRIAELVAAALKGN
jgi:lysophospholipase L1-like esterase